MKLIDMISGFFPHDAEVKDFFNHHCESMEVRKNEIISRNGNINRKVYFVEKGLMRSFYYENGKDITTNFCPEGKLIANIDTLFSNLPAKNNIEALEDSEVIFCNYMKLEEFCERSLSASNFSRFILGRLMMQMSERISTLQYMTAKERYEDFLKNQSDILLRAPLGNIASYLGISQETLSRIRSTK